MGDDLITRMASVEIPFKSVVDVMFNYCHVIAYVQIEIQHMFKLTCIKLVYIVSFNMLSYNK